MIPGPQRGRPVAPTYEQWNDALIEHVTCVRKGSPVYLSIDDRALLLAWRHLLSQSEGDVASVRAAFARYTAATAAMKRNPPPIQAMAATRYGVSQV